jgi:hypothetical protein
MAVLAYFFWYCCGGIIGRARPLLLREVVPFFLC